MSKARFQLDPIETNEFGDASTTTRPQESVATPSSTRSRRSRKRIYDLETFNDNEQLVLSLKQRVKAMDERKSQLEAYLRSARTSQWVSKQEADQLANEFRKRLNEINTTDQAKKMQADMIESQATLKSLYQEVRDVRDTAIDLAKTCDIQREAIHSSQVELDVLKSRFLRALPHVSGEVFLPESANPSEHRPRTAAPPPPRVKPHPLPLPSLPTEISLAPKFSLEIGACAIGRIFRKMLLRRALKKFAPVSPVFLVFAEFEISRFRRFLGGRGLPELSTLQDPINARDFLEIVTRTGYATPGALTAAFARGGVRIDRKYVIECI